MKSGDLFKFALLAGGAYLLYEYLQSSGLWAQWFGGSGGLLGAGNAGAMLPAGTILPSGTGQPAGGNTGTVSILLHDNNGSSIFKAGDQFTLTVTGPPNAPVLINAIQNGQQLPGPTQLGSTDATGRFVLTGNWIAANVGAWSENITVGGHPAPPLNFNILAGLAGVGAIVPVPNNGPVVAPVTPVPSMSFGNNAWGGSGRWQRGKINRWVQ
jgi:hypothetical protein